jgi:hypothetical protein
MEAMQVLQAPNTSLFVAVKEAISCPDFNQRRFYQKQVFYRLPLRPLIKFFYLMVICRAFLDGRAGITYATLMLIYEYFIALKVQEFSRGNRLVDSEDPTILPPPVS